MANVVAQILLCPEHHKILRFLGMETAFKELVNEALERFIESLQEDVRVVFVSPSRHYTLTSVQVSPELAAKVAHIADEHGVGHRTVYHHAMVAFLMMKEQRERVHALLEMINLAVQEIEQGAQAVPEGRSHLTHHSTR
jgi:hypothetical protein